MSKTYEVVIKETVYWKVLVEGPNQKIAKDMAVHKVSHNDYNHFPMVGPIRYSVHDSCRVEDKNNGS